MSSQVGPAVVFGGLPFYVGLAFLLFPRSLSAFLFGIVMWVLILTN